MRGDPFQRNGDGPHSIALMTEKKTASSPRPHDPVFLTPLDAHPQRPSARNTPMLSFQLPHREFITTQSSVSGTLNLHIPKLNGKRFHFVSLTLHLRLKESISWTRQDLVTFEIEKEDWAQTVWEKAIGLSPEDRQGMDESKEGTFVAVVKEPRAHGEGRIEIIADEWSWDWSLTLADEDPRAESFEGSMGNIWYELEAKCLFRWDEVDKDGNIQTVHPGPYVVESALETKIGNALRVPTIKKSQEGPIKKIGSLAHAFSKMRAGSKSNKTHLAGDFKIANQHQEFTKESLRMRNAPGDKDQTCEGVAGQHNEHDDSTARNPGISPPGSSNSAHSSSNHPLPFLIRKNIKIYMVRPFSATPSALPTPTNGLNSPPSPQSPRGSRRLKATIPGGQIQVQIQVPNIVYIPGYSKTSQLVPDSKKGGLVLRRDHRQREGAHPCLEHPENFDVILTVQKTTQDATRIGPGAKRQHSLDIATPALPIPTTSAAMGNVTPDHYHAPIERPGDRRQHLAVGGQSPDPRRTEVRVRKVKCEFFQKEMCRIPTEGSPSRTIKLMLGPTYSYTNKERRQEHHREFFPVHQTSNQSSNMSWDEGLSSMNSERENHRHFGRSDSLAESDMALLFPLPPQEPVNHGAHNPGVQGDSLHGSPSSNPRYHSPLAGQPSPQQASRPFIVQLPVSLTSSKLRQSTTWPCPDPPSTAPKSDDCVSPTIPTVAGNGLSSPDKLNLNQYEMDIRERYAYNARNYYVPHGGQNSNHITGRPRIEVTHYLAIRISTELLQCEGEYGGAPEFGLDSVGRESLHQDQGLPMIATAVATPPSVPQQHPPHGSNVSGQNGANNSETTSQKEQSPGSNVSTEPTSATTIVTTFVGAAATPSAKEMTAVQSMPLSLNSAAGLSSTEMGESHDSAKSHAVGPYEQGNGYQAAPLFGMAAGAVKHRRGSGASLGTTVSVSSISSNHSSSIPAAHPSGGRLVTNALNALKKKASMTALNSMVSAISGGQRHGSLQPSPMPLYSSSPVSPSMLHQHMHRSSPSTVMSVQKLKDFVINVPVTIAIQDPAEEPSLGMNTHLGQYQCRDDRSGESLRAYPVSGPISGSMPTSSSNCSAEGLRNDSGIESKALTELSLHHQSESEISFSGEHVEDAEGADELLITEDAH